MDWNEIFYYDSGELLWNLSPRASKKRGDAAGYIERFGYKKVQYKMKCYMAHRIIWEMHNGPIPDGMEIDHINHVRDDNRIENLRLVTHSDNQKNQKQHKTNTSGVTGVHWSKHRRKWVAKITINGKHFNLGGFDSKELAISARKNAEKWTGFHENHGE